VEQRYVLANPFAGIKVRGSQRAMAVETTHAFTEGEWLLVRTIANGLEWSYGWQAAAAQRLRFLLDFGYATGCGSANWPMPRCVTSTSTPWAITGCTWSAKVASPLGSH
jgi:hypothetical protein